MAPEPAQLRHLAVEAASTAAAMVRERVGRVGRIDTKSSATDLVTEVDRAAEDLVASVIHRERPDDGVLGEEGSSAGGKTGVRWIVDPIDGTTNFVYGHPGFGVSVAAEVDGLVVAGAVADPMRTEVFSAARGAGAQLDDHPLSVRPTSELSDALVATGFSYRRERRLVQGRVAAELLGHVRDIRRVGAASLDLCWVACGRVDAYYERGLKPWDWAAGALIASEAGAVVSGLAPDDEPSGDYVVAAAPGIAPDLLAVLGRLEALTAR